MAGISKKHKEIQAVLNTPRLEADDVERWCGIKPRAEALARQRSAASGRT